MWLYKYIAVLFPAPKYIAVLCPVLLEDPIQTLAKSTEPARTQPLHGRLVVHCCVAPHGVGDPEVEGEELSQSIAVQSVN